MFNIFERAFSEIRIRFLLLSTFNKRANTQILEPELPTSFFYVPLQLLTANLSGGDLSMRRRQ